MKRCTHCHEIKEWSNFSKQKTTRDGLQSWCNNCKRIAKSIYYYNNKKTCNETSSKWKQNNKQKVDGWTKQYYKTHIDIFRARDRKRNKTPERKLQQLQYQIRNRTKLSAQSKQRYWAKREEILEKRRLKYKQNVLFAESVKDRMKLWAKSNPDKIRLHRIACNRKRRTNNQSHISTKILKAVLERETLRCHICHKKISKNKITFDHIVPVSKKGDDSVLNLRLAHLSCNSKRGAGRIPAQMVLV